MPGDTSTTVTFSSDLEPEPRSFDQDTHLTRTIPALVRDLLERHPRAADLWTIAATCFAVDRNLRRPARDQWRHRREWSRTIRSRVPVQDPAWWSAHIGHVERLLTWLTADTWELEPCGGRPLHYQSQLFELEHLPLGTRTVLFSGGLDSVCGLIADMEETGEPLCAVSVSTNSRMRNVQKGIYDQLRGADPRLRGELPFTLQVHLDNPEDTARTRGFVFLAAGVVSAIATGTGSLLLYENGPGALNLALSRGQVGAQAARAVHPKTLLYMERLARAVTGDERFRIENPCFGLTKAQMVRRVPDDDDHDRLLAASVSCDTGFSHHGTRNGGESHPHCGGCSSCVLRRQALAAAGRRVPTPARGVPDRKREHHALMVWQVARLRRALSDGLSWERMVREFPDIVCDPRSFHPGHRRVLLDLFRSYAEEWGRTSVIDEFAGDGGLGDVGQVSLPDIA